MILKPVDPHAPTPEEALLATDACRCHKIEISSCTGAYISSVISHTHMGGGHPRVQCDLGWDIRLTDNFAIDGLAVIVVSSRLYTAAVAVAIVVFLAGTFSLVRGAAKAAQVAIAVILVGLFPGVSVR